MRLTTSIAEGNMRIKVQIKDIDTATGEYSCNHLSSNRKIVAINPSKFDVEVGQVVMADFQRNNTGGYYIISDPLLEVIEAEIKQAQHIIAPDARQDKMVNCGERMYVSLVIEEPKTQQRMLSIIKNTDRLFNQASLIVTGDRVKITMNDDNVYGLHYIKKE